MGKGAETTVAACVVLHESRAYLPRLVESLRRQDHGASSWIFCVNGEDDGSIAWLNELPEKPSVLHHPENPGFAGGVNHCIAAAEATYVLLLNPDVELASDYIASCLAVFAEEKGVAGVGGKLIRGNEESIVDTAGFVMQPWMRIVDRGAGASAADNFAEREGVVGICGAAALFDRAALQSVAEDGRVMDEDFWMYKEDQDLCMRLREAGWRLVYEPAAVARHERSWQPSGRDAITLDIRRHSLKNRYLWLMKHWRWRQHGWTLPFVVGFEILLFCGLMIREPLTMKGYLFALRLAPKMWLKRRRLIRKEVGRALQGWVFAPSLVGL